MHWHKGHGFCHMAQFPAAIRVLRLPYHGGRRIAAAADSDKDSKMRRRLIEAFGLEKAEQRRKAEGLPFYSWEETL